MRYLSLLLWFMVVVCACHSFNTLKSGELRVLNGRIRGSTMTSRLGRKIYSFRGLRYAEAPIGERRFMPAVPAVPWSNVFDATKDGPSCPQARGTNHSEDCLRLNVYTTKLPFTHRIGVKNPLRPVIVYFHRGTFYDFSSQSSEVGPNYFMDQDVVLVTVNYRLGALGFLSTGDAVAPGNLAFKDQVQALRWVKKNIATFGGNPNSVTISGYSVGSWSVDLHLLSPMSRGLFHRAIAMGGSPIYQTPLRPHQNDLAKKLAELLGCPSNNSTAIVQCLRTKKAMDIAATLPEFFEWRGNPRLIWLPVVEPKIPGVERFLTGQPSDLIKQGKINSVPFIFGFDKDAFAGLIVPMVEEARNGNTSIFNDYNERWNEVAPISFFYERGTPRSTQVSAALRQFYLNGQPLSLDNVDGLGRLYSDALLISSRNNWAQLWAQASKQPVYLYEFRYQGRYSHTVWKDTKKPFGVVHNDFLLYLFWDQNFPYFETTSPEYPTVERITTMWAHFAKTGEPIPRANPKFKNISWIPYNVHNHKYLEIGNELIMKKCLHKERMRLWESLFPVRGVSTPEICN